MQKTYSLSDRPLDRQDVIARQLELAQQKLADARGVQPASVARREQRARTKARKLREQEERSW